MQSPPISQSPPPVSRADLGALYADLKAADQAIRSAVLRAAQLSGSGVCEEVEGGPLEWAIGMVCRMTGADSRMIIGAGEVLAHLPTVQRLWADGLLTWGQIRAITLAARRLPIAARAELDERIAATHGAYDGIDAFDPDHLVEAIDRAANELGDARRLERAEERGPSHNIVALQPALDGRVRGYFDLDPIAGATVVNGLDAAAPQPIATPDHQPGAPTRRGHQYAESLVEMAAEYLSGVNSSIPREGNPSGKRRRALPLFVAHVQTSDVTRTEGAVIELNVRGRLTRITCATLELLSNDFDLQAVIFDGARPLAVSRKLRAEKIPDDTRVAVLARDLGDRFPGSRDPVGHLEVHHLRHREHGGNNDVDNLGGFAKRIHLGRIHKYGWRIKLDGPTGMMTFHRKGRVWRSLPRGTGLARAPAARAPDEPRSPACHPRSQRPQLPF